MNEEKKSKQNKKKSYQLKARFIFLIVRICLIAMALCVITFGAYFYVKKFFQVKVENLHKTLTSQIENVAELTALKNNYSDVVCVKKSAAAGLAKSYSIVKYNGVIRAGIKDLSSISIIISKDSKKVLVPIPHIEILGNGVIFQEVFDEKNNVFIPITTQEIFTEIQNGMNTTQDELIGSGFLLEAGLHMKTIVESLLESFNFKEIKVVCL